MRENHAQKRGRVAPINDLRLGMGSAPRGMPAENRLGAEGRADQKMPKRNLTESQKTIIKSILAQMPAGANWAQKESRHAIWLMARDFGVEEDQKAEFKEAVDVFINPSACAQFLAALDKANPCYRERIEKAAKLDEYE